MTDLILLCLAGHKPCRPRHARRAGLGLVDGVIRISVTTPAKDGRATEAARAPLAVALGVAKTQPTVVRRAKSRDKPFRLGDISPTRFPAGNCLPAGSARRQGRGPDLARG